MPGMVVWIVGVTSTFPMPLFAAALKTLFAVDESATGVADRLVGAVQRRVDRRRGRQVERDAGRAGRRSERD